MFVYFSMLSHMFSLWFFFFFFYGRSFLCFVVFSHWESLVLGYVDVKNV